MKSRVLAGVPCPLFGAMYVLLGARDSAFLESRKFFFISWQVQDIRHFCIPVAGAILRAYYKTRGSK